MDEKKPARMKSHGTGLSPWAFKARGDNVVIEGGVLVFHPENISLGENIYVGHQSILKGYYRNEMFIEDGCWIGQQCFFHSAGGLFIGKQVGIGPGVRILTSQHDVYQNREMPILHRPITFAPVRIWCWSDDSAWG
jgi:acetyltransferase-like isoleucine patch superfamily enzyme